MLQPGHEFFRIPTLLLAERLLGKIFVLHDKSCGTVLKGRIVETEAYLAPDDKACHASGGKTPRNSAMFGEPGTLYVYFTYGIHFLMNIVSEPAGTAGAVLLRAMEPLEGIELMRKRRNKERLEDLLSGPAKITEAFGIDLSFCGRSLSGPDCHLETAPDIPAFLVGSSPRIGISKSTELFWRKFIVGNRHVSGTGAVHKSEKTASPVAKS